MDDYAHFRPSYPASTVKLIMDYHRAHSNSLRLAHDIGAGSGNFTPVLAEYFQHVHVSDSDASNLSNARERLGNVYAQNWWKGKFSFSTTAPELAGECMVDGSLDMATLMMCAHDTDIEAVVRSVGRSLAPNGTLVVVQYNPACKVVDNEPVNAALQDLFRALGTELVRIGRVRGREIGDWPAWLREMAQRNAGIDYVPLPEGQFIQDVTKRIKINARRRGNGAYVWPGQEDYSAHSLVGSLHRKYNFEWPEEEAEGWRQDVDIAWLRGLVGNIMQGEGSQLSDEHFHAVEQSIQNTSADGKVAIEWTVAILLATKK